MTKKEEFKVTPYEVSGEVDYSKLVKEFISNCDIFVFLVVIFS
jgi:hypothetical protein